MLLLNLRRKHNLERVMLYESNISIKAALLLKIFLIPPNDFLRQHCCTKYKEAFIYSTIIIFTSQYFDEVIVRFKIA